MPQSSENIARLSAKGNGNTFIVPLPHPLHHSPLKSLNGMWLPRPKALQIGQMDELFCRFVVSLHSLC
jgi:hypothetical protein